MKNRFLWIIYAVIVLVIFIFAIWVVYYITTHSSRLDFRTFFGAGTAAAGGVPIYSLYGIYMHPFWYFPWVAWQFIPFTPFTFSQAWYAYILLCCGLLWGIVVFYSKRFSISENLLDKVFIYSMSLLLCMMLFNFGQTNILVLAWITLVVVLLEQKKHFLAGIVMPLSLIKPHLLIIFVIAFLLKGGKKGFIGAALSSLAMFGLEFLLDPTWIRDFIELFAYGSKRDDDLYWDHTTLPNLLGFDENYVGTANLPIILLLLLIGTLVVWKFRTLPPSKLIALGLAGSLLGAPRAFGYDLVLLLPAMMLLSERFSWKTFLLWIMAIIIPFAYNFSTGSYILTLLVFGLSVWKLRQQGTKQYDILTPTSNAYTP